MASGGATEDMFTGEEFEEKEAAPCGIRAIPGSGLLHGHHKPVKTGLLKAESSVASSEHIHGAFTIVGF